MSGWYEYVAGAVDKRSAASAKPLAQSERSASRAKRSASSRASRRRAFAVSSCSPVIEGGGTAEARYTIDQIRRSGSSRRSGDHRAVHRDVERPRLVSIPQLPPPANADA